MTKVNDVDVTLEEEDLTAVEDVTNPVVAQEATIARHTDVVFTIMVII